MHLWGRANRGREGKYRAVISKTYVRQFSGWYIPAGREENMDWIESIEARNRKQAKYDKENTVGIYMKLNIHTDRDIIRWFWGQPSKQGAIKRLIREEIARQSSDGINH